MQLRHNIPNTKLTDWLQGWRRYCRRIPLATDIIVFKSNGKIFQLAGEPYHGGGPIAWIQEENKAVWEINTPTLEELKATALAEIKVKLADSDYRALKFLDGSYTATEYEVYRLERRELREKYNAIEVCTTKEELEVLLKEM